MATYTKENLEKVTKLFGAPLGRMPDVYPKWDGPTGTIFWAPQEHWNSFMLHRESSCAFKFSGPFTASTVPFTVKPNCNGYSIFVPDKDDE